MEEFYCINCDEWLTQEQFESEQCPACNEHPGIRVFHCQGNGCDSKDTQERQDNYALTIFLKYGNPRNPTHCEHDVLHVDIDPDIVSKEDTKRLKKV